MRADDLIKRYRTQNDGGPELFVLSRVVDDWAVPSGAVTAGPGSDGKGTVVLASDDAVAVMDVQFTDVRLSVPGTLAAAGEGAFSFAATNFPSEAGQFKFDIRVSDYGVSDTWARGTMIVAADI